MGLESRHGLAGSFAPGSLQSCEMLVKAEVLLEGSIVGASASELIWLLAGFGSLRTVGLRALVPSCFLAGGLPTLSPM